MVPSNLSLSLCLCFFLLISVGQCSSDHHHHHHRLRRHEKDQQMHDHNAFQSRKLFVFGDSYADTGNVRKSLANSWKNPYGSTFPGKPAGRFSDGRVLTDYFAKFLGLKTPVGYIWMKFVGKDKLRNGINFAYGGSGVFNTSSDVPNMTTQIDFLEKLINSSVYTNWDLKYSSVALISLAGNDYAAYIANGGSIQGLPTFISLVVDQLLVNIKRIRGLGVSKIAVTSLEPLGCLPRITQMSLYQQCNISTNLAASYHNLLLQQAVAKLNNNKSAESTVFVLDLYSSFTSLLEQKGDFQGNMKFQTPLKPCCIGISSGYTCGNVDKKGMKMYRVCSDPNSAFFWDSSHPTQAGWLAVYNTLKPSLEQFLKFS